MNPSIGIGITVFNQPARLAKLLEVLGAFEGIDAEKGRLFDGTQIRIFEDRWRPHVHDEYKRMAAAYSIPFAATPEWSCMQGSAELAARGTPEDWFIYLPDDVLPTPDCLKNVIHFCRLFHETNVDAFQIPYWNADELPNAPWGEHKRLDDTHWTKDFMWEAPPRWLCDVPPNPKWQANGIIPIVNLNGAGFALRTAAHRAVGGFSQVTWCLDEDMSARIWTRGQGKGLIAAVPGPPLVHYMGGSIQQPPHHFHCLDCWEKAGWPRDKDGVLHPIIRTLIRDRTGFGRENEYDGEQPWRNGWWK